MTEEPCGLEAAAESALKLAGADPLLAGAHQVDRLKPNPKRDMAGLEDGSHAHGERLAAGVALVETGPGGLALQASDPLRLSAMLAHRATRPEPRFDVFKGGFFA